MALGLPIVSKFDDKGVNEAESALHRLGGVAKGIGVAAAAGLAVASAAAVAFGVSALKAAADADHITENMANAAKNAGLYGSTAAEIEKVTVALDKHSTKLAEATGVDDEYINSLKTSWLSVPAIAGMGIDGINRLATISLNIAASAGKDAEGVATSIAKAFENPETALTKLQKAGVFLTDQQNEMYNSLVRNGQAAEAQAYLVGELETKYKGAAEAAANPFERLKVIFENLQETIGSAMLPAIEKIVPVVAEFVSKLTASPAFQQFIEILAETFSNLMDVLIPLLQPIMDLVMVLLPPLMSLIQALAPVVALLVESFIPLIDGILPPLIQLINQLLPIFVELVNNLIVPLIPVITTLVQAFMPLIQAVLPILSSTLTALMPLLLLVANILTGVLTIAIGFFTQALQKVTPIVQLVGQVLGGVFTSIGPVIVGALNWIIGVFEGFLNFMGDGMNKLIDPLNILLKGIAQATGGSISLKVNRIPKASLPRLADGGIVMPDAGGTIAQIAEAGKPEAVIPLDRLDSMMASKQPVSSGATYNINVTAGLGADGASIGEQIVTAIRKYERTSGAVFARA